MAETEIAGIIVPAVVTDDLVAKPVVDLLIEKYKAGKDSLSLADMHEVLNYGLEQLLALQRDKEHEVSRDVIQKDPSEVYKIWKKQVSNIEKKAASLNREYEEEEEKEWCLCSKIRRLFHKNRGILEENIKRALSEVIKLIGDECPKHILVYLPSIVEYPTLQEAFKDIQTQLQSDRVKCVALDGQTRMGKTIIMEHLNNHFCGSIDFDVVIFIKLTVDNEQTDLQILQKIAERTRVDTEGHESEVAERIQKVLKNKRYLLILDGVWNPINGIWEMLDISKDKKHSKVVISTYVENTLWGLGRGRGYVDERVMLRRLSRTEEWKMFQHTVGHNHLPPAAKPASPLEGESSSKSSTNAIGKPHLVQDVLRLMRIQDFVHLMLSYPMRIGYEKFLKQWIDNVYELNFADYPDIDSFWRRVERLLYGESPLLYLQAVIPQDITTEIIKGGSVSRETALKHVPKPILLLATHLALHELTLTLTPDTIHYSWRALQKLQTIWFSTTNDAEKRTVVEDVQANSQILAAFDLEIVDLNQIDDETKREQVLLNLEKRLEQTATRRRLVLMVDGDGDKKADPLRVSLPMNDSRNVVVFITTLSSNDYLTSKVDLTIKTEDHLLPWELFCNIAGSELLHSSIAIQEIAVQIVEKCRGHLLAIILMANSLKHVADVVLWELALQKLLYRDREAIVNALIFNIIWANEMSEREKARLIRCLMVLKFQDYGKMSDDQLFARWFSQKLVGTEKEAESILQNFMECSLLLQFEGTQGGHIILPEDIKIIFYTIGQDIPENLSDGELVSTIPNLQVLNLSYTHLRYLYNVTTDPQLKNMNLSGWLMETLPRAICKLKTLEILLLEGCLQLRELPPQIAELENLKELSLNGCERLETLPQEIWELHKLETLSLEQCSQLLELSPSPQIAELENLKDLRLAGCTRLEALPQEIWELPNLKTLSLAGTSIFPSRENQELINSDDLPHSSSIYREHSGPGKKTIPSSSSTIIPNGFTLKLKTHGRFKQFENFCQYIMQFQIPNLEKCDLSGTHITDLPPSLDFPNLRSLSLGNNLNLMEIPSSFFNHVPLLSILDLSRTSIHELPSSIFKLEELKQLCLKECELFVELSPKINLLTNLTTLDLDGTLITRLPEAIKELKKLESLSLSFCNDSGHDDSRFDVIPYGVLTEFTYLKVLRIDVNSDNEWWLKHFENFLAQISTLQELQLLDVYIPRVNFRPRIKKSLSNFRFIIGHHRPRMISRVPLAIEVKFRESGRSLKFVNGNEDFPAEVKTILSEARAFFLDRHMTVKNLTDFGLENLKQLRLCILAECNDMQSIVEVGEQSFCMRFLTIFYMKNLRNIINRPILGCPVFSELKLLALHTCPELTTIFTMDFLHGLINLEELIVEDCPKVQSIISCPSSKPTTDFLPGLRKLSLLFVPELASISNGVRIARNLEQIGLYYCPKLQSLSTSELSSEKLKVIRAETKWWGKLQWSKVEWGQEDPPHKFSEIFSPFDEDLDILTQLAPYELMTSFNTENDSE